jgi:hypothetical protein
MFKDYFSFEELQVLESNPFKAIHESCDIFLFLKLLWESNFSEVGFSHLATEIFRIIESSEGKSNQEIILQIDCVLQDREFKKQARQTRKHDYKPRMLFQY